MWVTDILPVTEFLHFLSHSGRQQSVLVLFAFWCEHSLPPAVESGETGQRHGQLQGRPGLPLLLHDSSGNSGRLPYLRGGADGGLHPGDDHCNPAETQSEVSIGSRSLHKIAVQPTQCSADNNLVLHFLWNAIKVSDLSVVNIN